MLPFENLSDEKANAYFADGIQDEILTKLASIRRLKGYLAHVDREVQEQAGRSKDGFANSWVSRRCSKEACRKPARKCTSTCSSSTRRATAICGPRATTATLKNFGVERDVAEKVAGTLKATLMPEEAARGDNVLTKNAEAYDLYCAH